jgi:hypothetical protein
MVEAPRRDRRPVKEHAMREHPSRVSASANATNAAPGICSTCTHAATCLFLRAASNPVWHCDEFSDSAGVTAMREATVPVTAYTPGPYSVLTMSEEGLCVNCDARSSCKLRRADFPVHDCDEFR